MKIVKILFLTLLLSTQFVAQNNGLISHWKFNSASIEGPILKDLVGNSDAELKGQFQTIKVGDIEAREFDGFETTALITNNISSANLPKGSLTVSGWVLLNQHQEHSGMIGAFQDNGDFEKGWVVGFMKGQFGIALSSKGSDDGNGFMTYLTSKEKLQIGQWYHVAATYDETTLKLYINGKFSNESKAQSGKVLYPENAFYEIGSYHDKNELFPLNGAIYEVKLHSIALTEEAINDEFEKHKNLSLIPPLEAINSDFVALPYLQFATQTSIRILWETKSNSNSIVKFGEEYPLTETSINKKATKSHQIELTNLKPETNYFYRVISTHQDGTETISEPLTFQTAVKKNTPILFGIVSDTQNNPKVWGKISGMVYAERPNFVIHAGDIVGNGDIKREWVDEFLFPGNKLMSRIPIYTSIGNHEKNDDNFYKYMSNPAPEYYYSFVYGNVKFFMIDSNKDLLKNSEQYKMIEKDLKQSNEKWKIAVFHHPPYSSDENDYGDTYRGKSSKGDPDLKDLVKLFEAYNLDLVINGHIHTYERTLPIRENKIDNKNGITYLVMGGAGGGLEDFAPTRNWFMAKVKRDNHYGTILINDNTLSMSAFDINGKMFDNFSITKK